MCCFSLHLCDVKKHVCLFCVGGPKIISCYIRLVKQIWQPWQITSLCTRCYSTKRQQWYKCFLEQGLTDYYYYYFIHRFSLNWNIFNGVNISGFSLWCPPAAPSQLSLNYSFFLMDRSTWYFSNRPAIAAASCSPQLDQIHPGANPAITPTLASEGGRWLMPAPPLLFLPCFTFFPSRPRPERAMSLLSLSPGWSRCKSLW